MDLCTRSSGLGAILAISFLCLGMSLGRVIKTLESQIEDFICSQKADIAFIFLMGSWLCQLDV